ncbi:MAG: hypothetical protein LQ338_007589 [Usnochroma carphineum]|nr:MAG: hypothetical protein LQ338_007589 [Usnochroma carphineum]
MNWTGGSLSRSRKQNANLTGIQKKHFAKVRGRLLSGRPPPPRLDVSLFQDARNDGGVPSFTAPDSNRHKELRKTQLTLDEYENVRPVVKQLQSLKPRHAQKSTRSQPTESQRPPQPSERNPSTSSRSKQEKSHQSAHRREQKVRADSCVTGSTAITPNTDELEAKRRKLLGTSDWMGLKKIKPLEMHFPDAEDRDLIGKRRRVNSDQYRAVQEASTPNQYRKPIIDPYEKLDMLRANSNVLSSPSKISIHIGSSGRETPARRRDGSDSRSQDFHYGRASEEMLFDDQESAQATIHHRASTENSHPRSKNASDETLFSREWSGIASPFNTEPPAIKENPHQQPPDPRNQHTGANNRPAMAYTISSGTESEYSDEAQYIADQLHDSQEAQNVASEITALRCPGIPQGRQNIRQPSGENERRPSCNEQKVVGCPSNQLSKTSQRGQKQGAVFAQATARELASLLPAADAPEEALDDVGSGRSWDVGHGTVIPQSIHRDHMTFPIHGQEQHTLSELPLKQTNQAASLHNTQPNAQNAAPVTAEAPIKAPTPGPLPTSAVQEPQPEVPNPADPTPEDDELIWRTFVFGTKTPEEDWIFDRPLPKTSAPSNPTRPDGSSSPIIPTINATDHATKQSSPIPQTQPSLLVEASSSPLRSVQNPRTTSPPQSPSPARFRSSIAEASSTSPIHPMEPSINQHSTQAKPLTTTTTNTSSDELALSISPSRPPPPAVTFRRPKRYVGESSSPVAGIRLGVQHNVRKRGNLGDRSYGEKERGRKRGDWRGEVREAMEQQEEERDEIVDD